MQFPRLDHKRYGFHLALVWISYSKEMECHVIRTLKQLSGEAHGNEYLKPPSTVT